MIKILDCTLRDGGYYTNWDFEDSIVDEYFDAVNHLPIDYVELGYRSPSQLDYKGKYFYLPPTVLKKIREKCQKPLALMLNEKDVRKDYIDELLSPGIGIITMVRLAVNPTNFKRAVELAKEIKKLGFEIAFNVMYMSEWKNNTSFFDELHTVNSVIDYFYMVDSFGGVYPEDVKETFELVNNKINVPIGFHGHNNLELALINTLTAIQCGVSIVDATFTGMGRGAGNLKTELLLTALNSKKIKEVSFNHLAKGTDAFAGLKEKFDWGTSLPYMVSGAHSLPQKQVMEWVVKRYFSFNSIIRALDNQSKGVVDNYNLKSFVPVKKDYSEKAILIGGGPNVLDHLQGIIQFLEINKNIPIVHASAKHTYLFKNLGNRQYSCLLGNEGYRLENKYDNSVDYTCVLPPSPRELGTYIPRTLLKSAFELDKLETGSTNSHTAIALELLKKLKVKEVYTVGYDGYDAGKITDLQQELFMENKELFNSVAFNKNMVLISLTPTKYSELHSASIYEYLQ